MDVFCVGSRVFSGEEKERGEKENFEREEKRRKGGGIESARSEHVPRLHRVLCGARTNHNAGIDSAAIGGAYGYRMIRYITYDTGLKYILFHALEVYKHRIYINVLYFNASDIQ